MSGERFPVTETAELVDLAHRLRSYLQETNVAHFFLIIGASIASYWLYAVALSLLFSLSGSATYWVAAFIVMFLFLAAVLKVLAQVTPKVGSSVRREKREFLAWFLPFVVLYALPMPAPAFYSIAWYPALTVALLLNHFLVERGAVRRREVASRPFLVSGVFNLCMLPLVLYSTLISLFASWLFALSSMLASYTFAAYRALRSARTVLVGYSQRLGGVGEGL